MSCDWTWPLNVWSLLTSVIMGGNVRVKTILFGHVLRWYSRNSSRILWTTRPNTWSGFLPAKKNKKNCKSVNAENWNMFEVLGFLPHDGGNSSKRLTRCWLNRTILQNHPWNAASSESRVLHATSESYFSQYFWKLYFCGQQRDYVGRRVSQNINYPWGS